jgi:hypothetical protein
MKRLNWKNDDSGGMTAWASRTVGGKYRISRREDSGGVWFEVEHFVHSGGSSFRYADWWGTPVRHQPVARSWREAIDAAEGDNDRRRAIKERGAA